MKMSRQTSILSTSSGRNIRAQQLTTKGYYVTFGCKQVGLRLASYRRMAKIIQFKGTSTNHEVLAVLNDALDLLEDVRYEMGSFEQTRCVADAITALNTALSFGCYDEEE